MSSAQVLYSSLNASLSTHPSLPSPYSISGISLLTRCEDGGAEEEDRNQQQSESSKQAEASANHADSAELRLAAVGRRRNKSSGGFVRMPTSIMCYIIPLCGTGSPAPIDMVGGATGLSPVKSVQAMAGAVRSCRSGRLIISSKPVLMPLVSLAIMDSLSESVEALNPGRESLS